MPPSDAAAPPTWLQAMREMAPEAEAAPGVTVGEMLAHHDRLEPPAGSVLLPDEVYMHAGDAPVHLSVYARADRDERRPGVVFIHGGGWAGGCPTFHARHCAALAEQGYVAATIEYRLAPQVRWPEPLLDCKRAIGWLRANHGRLGLDPKRVVVAGGSAGGHLAAMVALTSGRWEPEGAPAGGTQVCAAVLWYPCVDLAALLPVDDAPAMVEGLLGSLDPHSLTEASPLSHVHPGAPPVLTMTGALDQLTTERDIRRFHEALDVAGVPNRLSVHAGADHAFELFPDGWNASYPELLAFLDDVTAAAAA